MIVKVKRQDDEHGDAIIIHADIRLQGHEIQLFRISKEARESMAKDILEDAGMKVEEA